MQARGLAWPPPRWRRWCEGGELREKEREERATERARGMCHVRGRVLGWLGSRIESWAGPRAWHCEKGSLKISLPRGPSGSQLSSTINRLVCGLSSKVRAKLARSRQPRGRHLPMQNVLKMLSSTSSVTWHGRGRAGGVIMVHTRALQCGACTTERCLCTQHLGRWPPLLLMMTGGRPPEPAGPPPPAAAPTHLVPRHLPQRQQRRAQVNGPEVNGQARSHALVDLRGCAPGASAHRVSVAARSCVPACTGCVE